MELFNEFRDGETLYLDLDTLIRGSCENVINAAKKHQFVILRELGPKGDKNPLAMGSGIMFWRYDYKWLFDLFMEERPEAKIYGDQDFLDIAFQKQHEAASYWQDITSDVCSYKFHVKDKPEPSSAAIVAFHGHPRPWHQQDVPYPMEFLNGRVI
jgi:hypothetical protein